MLPSRNSSPITTENLQTLKEGDCVCTPMGTGFFQRIGIGCAKSDCDCPEDEHCKKAVPMMLVKHDGGGVAWVELEGCTKLE